MVTAVSVTLTTLLLLSLGGVRTAPLINSSWGQIVGTDGTSPGGAPYSVYRAIPYALPPVRNRRFAKPVAHPGPGVGRVFNASSPGPMCPQTTQDTNEIKIMSEDCLTLNVYVPTSVSGGLKHVMIWIHGGGFVFESALYYIPTKLVTTNDVIVVVIQYRLGVLGFLSSSDDVIPGNFGLWDQVMAIEWVKDNIRAFGGDPNSTTLFGESAGAASVGYQLISPVNKGETFRAILQSGTPLANWAFQQDPGRGFFAVADKTGCVPAASSAHSMYYMTAGERQKAQNQQILSCLRGKDAMTLVEAVRLFPRPEGTHVFESIFPWVPSVDGEFLPRDPADLMRDATYLADVGALSRDVIMGFTNDEGGFLLAAAEFIQLYFPPATAQEILNDMKLDDIGARELLTGEVLFRYGQGLLRDPQRLQTLIDFLYSFYKQPLNGGQDKQQSVVDIFTDVTGGVPTVQFIKDLTKASDQMRSLGRSSGGRRYLYLFNHYPASRANLTRGRGTYHAEDLAYEFDNPNWFSSAHKGTADDLTLETTYMSMLTNFAKSGDPRLNVGQQAGGSWPQFSLADEKYLSLEVVPRVDSYLYNNRTALWLNLLPSLVNTTAGINMGYMAGSYNLVN